ncbi:spore coat protein U domain-containing protein [Kluyvera cryocrescens]|uniref:Csu type fimbrial protein n=1 Tax=Kluyvera cryocrescens TaxID=580 RepID=UPI0028BD7E89|nr:spore coat protein U domain-containing protein [Kluyvera cryocrescens]WNN71904.1 spore coat protein U domain-containing protein [Kluyvera cryocrescens]
MWLRVLILLAGICFFPMKSYAVNCTISAVPNVAFGTVNPFSPSDVTTSVTFNYTCTKVLGDLLGGYTLCFNLGAPGGNTIATRKMTTTGGSLNYQLYYKNTSGTNVVWGNQGAGNGTFPMVNINLLDITSVSGSLTLVGILTGGQATAPPGSYTDSYAAATAYVTINGAALAPPNSCSNTQLQTLSFAVMATINKQCNVNATNNVTLGSVPHTRTNITGNNFFTMTCTNTTPYTVGLSPSNSNTAGSGVMKSKSNAATNTDLVPYQLNSTAGVGGTPWGSLTANSVAGTGTGLAVNRTVYVVAPSANYRPDDYTDTVTINVTY